MVRRAWVLIVLACLPLLLPAAEASKLEPLPASPPHPAQQPNVAWEDFTAVTLISLPFTALWALIGAVTVASISQHAFPPSMDTPQLAGAAMVAAGASVSIGLVSVQWGGPKATPTPEAN